MDFGLIPTNTTVQASFVITNAGAGTLTGTAVVGGAPFYVVSGSPFTVPGLGSTSVVISFTPTSVNAFSDNVTFSTSAGNFTCAVTGTGGGMALGAALGTATLLVGSAAGSNSVVLTVTPQTGFWTATTNAAWLHLSPANQGGMGSTNVVFSYDANPGATRSGTLTIAGQTLTVTQAGSTYVAAGTVTTLVSSGLSVPSGVAVDGAGNVYIADTFNSAIKEWTAANHTVTTLVSSGLSVLTGVAVDGAGNVYIADRENNAIKEWTAANSNVTTLVSSGLSYPYRVAVDGAGNVYITDTGNCAIKEWTAANSNVTTLVSGLNYPWGVAVDGSGNLYISTSENDSIYKWTAANSTVTTLVPSVFMPVGVAVDGSGNVYIADNNSIKELPYAFVDPTPKFESMAAGNDALPVVLPATENLLAPFAPTSDQSWLTISGVTNGVVSFSFTATISPRTAHITVLGQTIPVTQEPIYLNVTPTTGFTADGPAGGPFNITAQDFSLTNTGIASLNWSLINTSPWLNASPSSGTLAGFGQTNVTISLNSVASNLTAGSYMANVWFTNQTTGGTQSRQFTLQVLEPLVITPTSGFAATGPVGGPFNVTSQDYLLNNISSVSQNWSVINTSSWLSTSSSGGTLAGFGQTNVTVSLNSTVNQMAEGIYTADIWFTNLTTGVAQSRRFNLLIGDTLQNGGFETGDFSYWTLWGDINTAFVYGGFYGSVTHSGNYGALLSTTGSLGHISQTVVTPPGQKYLLSLWFNNTVNPAPGHPATPNEFSVVWDGTTLFDQVDIPVTGMLIGWTNLQFIVTATASSSVLQFGFRNDPWHFGLDDVSLSPWPIAAPSFQSVTQSTNTVWLNWTALMGLPYQMQYKTNLLQPNWINWGSIVTATNTTMTIPDVIGPDPQRFYRIEWVPTY